MTFHSPLLGNAPISRATLSILNPQPIPRAIGRPPMVSRRKRCRGGGAVAGDGTAAEVTAPGYEQLRDQRVRENLERMQKLGIIELSLKLKSTAATPKRFPKISSEKEPPNRSPADEPPRRSSRYRFFFSPLVRILFLCVEKNGSEKSLECVETYVLSMFSASSG